MGRGGGGGGGGGSEAHAQIANTRPQKIGWDKKQKTKKPDIHKSSTTTTTNYDKRQRQHQLHTMEAQNKKNIPNSNQKAPRKKS
jgi:phage tail tape-measure protein